MNCIKDGKLTHDSCFGCDVKAESCEIKPIFEKQIPKKPVWCVDYEQFSSGYRCPTCGSVVSNQENYCSGCYELGEHGCGQALDWEVSK